MTNFENEPNPYPDNVYFDGQAVSWVGESEEGFDARLGVIQDGFDEVFPIPNSGERIWLYEPDGKQKLDVTVLEPDGREISGHLLQGKGIIFVNPGHDIRVTTPKGQGAITYMCDYPGVEPGSH